MMRSWRVSGIALAGILLISGPAGADSSRTRTKGIHRLLVSVLRDGVYLFDLKGEVLWSNRCDAYDAADAGGGEILVANRTEGRVYRMDRDGRTTWEKKGLRGPVNAEPLANGNVLIVENDSGVVLEVNPGGDVVRQFAGHRTPFDARRRANGNTVVADSGNNRIVEYDSRGLLLHETPGLKFPNSVTVAPEGRTLFTTYVNGTIGELDVNGTLLWERSIGGTLYSVERDGGVLWVADGAGGRVLRLSRDGGVLQEIKLGKTFVDVAWCR